MNTPRWRMGLFVADDKLFFAGGQSSFDVNGESVSDSTVEIYDLNHGSHTFHQLETSPNKIVRKNERLCFLSPFSGTSHKFDTYDLSFHAWSVCNLTSPVWTSAGWEDGTISAGNEVYVVGDTFNPEYNSQVWKLVF
jgi:hypothetical protein